MGLAAEARALRCAALGALALGLAWSGAALAQDPLRSSLANPDLPDDYDRGYNVSVAQRDHPEYDAIGVPVSAFLLYPKLSLGAGYLDNVFGSKTDKVGDAYFQLDPEATLNSDWSRNAVTLSAGADIIQYIHQTAEDEQGWHTLGSGRYDIDHDDTVTAGFTVRKLYEEQDSGFYPVGAIAPLGYIDADGYVRAEHQNSAIRLILATDFHSFDFDDVAAAGGGFLSESFNDHTSGRVTGHAEYSLTPDTAVFTEVSYQQNDYTHVGPSGGQDLNGDEERYLVGANFDLTHLIRGSVGAGYISRSYQDPLFQGVSGPAVDAHIEYFPTTLITVSGSVRRTVEDAVDFDVGGFFDTNSQIRVDYELLRQLLLYAQVNYENDDYRTVSRNDDITTESGGATYNLQRDIAVQLYAAHTNRASTGQFLGPAFVENRFVVRLVLQR